MRCCYKNKVHPEPEKKQIYYHHKDDQRSNYINEIIDITQKYFIPYNDVKYQGEENTNLLFYRVEQYKTFLEEKIKYRMLPGCFNNLDLFKTKQLFNSNLNTLANSNLKLLRDILRKHHNEKEEQKKKFAIV